MEAAERAAGHAYAPYSGSPVGAAVLASSGAVYAGCNVENSSYGLAVCAERNAVFQAVAAGERRVEAVAIFAGTDSPPSPCGACREVIAEFGPQARIVSRSPRGPERHWRLGDLLPHRFSRGRTPSRKPR